MHTIHDALRLLGEPQRDYPSLLIGGTNGKGSVVAVAEAILRADGRRVGATISPHLTDLTERIRVDGVDLSSAELAALARRVCAALDRPDAVSPITFFELIVACAFRHFADRRIDVAVVEVGMGGEFDATRACAPRAAAVVTVHLDHLEHLGPTLRDVARTKARIAPVGGIFVVGERAPGCAEVLDAEGNAQGATLWRRGVEFFWEPGPNGARFVGPARSVAGLHPGMLGAHQVENAAVAVAAVDALCVSAGLPLCSADAVRAGVAAARVPGRFEVWPGTDLRPTVLLDGAHNEAGAQALARLLATRRRPRRRLLLFAAMVDKDRRAVLAALLPHVDAVLCCAGGSTPRYTRSRELVGEVHALGGVAQDVGDPVRGLASAWSQLGPEDELLVAGSLYLLGDVRPLLSRESAPLPVSPFTRS